MRLAMSAKWSLVAAALVAALALPAHAQDARPIEQPTDATWASLRALVDKEAAAQGDMLNCVLLAYPDQATFAISDWDANLKEARATLQSAGYPPDQVDGLLASLAPERLIVAAPEREALVSHCKDDLAWQQRWSLLTWYKFKGSVREIVQGKR
jgi:hypothetical protein